MIEIIEELKEYCQYAYAPYSRFKVASAVVLKDKRVFKGYNIENASYGLSMCAERVALYHACTHQIQQQDVEYMIVYSNQEHIIYPCGACLQVMNELLREDTPIYLVNDSECIQATVASLLPCAFRKEVVL